MSRKWKFEEDAFIARYYNETTEYSIARFDISCTLDELRNRVKHLRRKGAWEILYKYGEVTAAIEWKFNSCLAEEEAKAFDAYRLALAKKGAAA